MSNNEILTVLDLPQLYNHPPATELISALSGLAISPISWNDEVQGEPRICEDGIPKYLTTIIASQLAWISEEDREAIWENASRRLCERSGRTAIPSASRTFLIPDPSNDDPLSIILYEPSLTGDNLGHKTWLASYLLAKRLSHLLTVLPSLHEPSALSTASFNPKNHPRLLELGAGTGLVGIAAALLFPTIAIHLTDLPNILSNLGKNVSRNIPAFSDSSRARRVTVGALDWSNIHSDGDKSNKEILRENSFDVILAADPLYSPLHPTWLIDTITYYLKIHGEARVVIELPLREVYRSEVQDFQAKMHARGFRLLKQGEEAGFEDWEDMGGKEKTEVRCWWGVWGWVDIQHPSNLKP